MRTFSLVLLLVACGDTKHATIDAPKPIDASPDGAPDAADDPRGPRSVMLAGGANALHWDAASSTLYLTNNDADTLLKFTDAGGVQTVGSLPAETAGISLGDIVEQADGTLLIANFGFGTQGTIFAVPPGGAATALTGLDPARRRIGLAQDPAGGLYEAYFVGGGMGVQNGGVATVTIAGGAATETEIAGTTTTAGFKKLVGVVATADAVYVSDQTQKMIFKIAIPDHTVTVLATVPSADLVSLMPNGDLLTGGTGVHRITPAGTVTTLSLGTFESVRGTAYDPGLRRLFLIEHSATVGVADKLHVVPLDD